MSAVLSADDGLSAVAQSSDGKLLGNWTCPNLGTAGTVYGVRVNNDLDLIYLAIADPGCTGPKTCPGHPDVNKPYQFMYVMDGAGVTKGGPGPCKVVQTVAIDPSKCMTPHLMGVNERNHDIYIACVGVRHQPLPLFLFCTRREICASEA